MNVRTRLEANLVSEAQAYGYTLSIWGAGALLIHSYGVPGVHRALAYVAGALAGFGVLALATFRGATAEAEVERPPSSLVASTVHVVSTGGTLGIVHLFLDLAGDGHPLVAFSVVGVLVTVAYNLLLLIETVAVRAAT